MLLVIKYQDAWNHSKKSMKFLPDDATTSEQDALIQSMIERIEMRGGQLVPDYLEKVYFEDSRKRGKE